MQHEIARRTPLWMRMGGRRVFYFGTAEKCDFCGSSVRTFLPNGNTFPILTERQVVGGMQRPNDRCPVCHAQDRTRLMQYYLEHRLGAGRGRDATLRVLNVAPDRGLVFWFQRIAGIDYTGCDLDAARYSHVKNFVEADLTDLPFDDDGFDVVICSHVLEHVPDDAKAMQEIFRVLKPGGQALLLVPLATDGGVTDEDPSVSDPRERERRFGQWDHIRLYERGDFVARIEQAGFAVELFDSYAEDAAEAEKRKLNPLELLPVATKPQAAPG